MLTLVVLAMSNIPDLTRAGLALSIFGKAAASTSGR